MENLMENLVVYFSSKGYVKSFAQREAKLLDADIYEIKTDEPIEGISGFWWCGLWGMKRGYMPIHPLDIDLSKYDHVSIFTPVWVFSISAPIRSFCKIASGKIKEADLTIVHFEKHRFNSCFAEAEKLLGLSLTEKKSICCRFGKKI